MSSRVVLATLRVHVGKTTTGMALPLSMCPNAVLLFLASTLVYSSSKDYPILKLSSGALGLNALQRKSIEGELLLFDRQPTIT